MDYEQKYKEALEKARQLCAYPTTKPFISDLQDLFPELAESDDERIRKGIIRNLEYLADRAEGFVKDELKERIAWLEKQGEHANFLSKIQVGDKVTRNKDGVLVNMSQLNRVAKKQGEQKPYGQRQECVDCQFNYAGECKGSCAMKRGEQKPACSEEDEKMFECALNMIEWYSIVDKDKSRSVSDWLKSIKDRVQHQPRQEWKQENTGDLTDFENAMMHIGGSFFGQHAGLDPNDTNAIKEQANLLLELVPKPVETFTTNKIE